MILKYPLSTEKTIRLMESQNTLLFVVERAASKEQIRKEIESRFGAKVETVNTSIGPDGEKKAYVKFAIETPAIDIATKLGLM
jgi:large subunit ribosomal protein L23